MITLALDEFGDFEGIENNNKPVGIAGILYDDSNDEGDTANERKRLKEFYKACIATANDDNGPDNEFLYPSALHSNGSKERDARIVKPVKRRVNACLSEFLRKGTYNGKELLNEKAKRKGKYYVFGIIKSDRGMNSLLSSTTNFLAHDDMGSNLYFHMASEAVNRMLFHNPRIADIKKVSMNIASRRSDDMEKNSLKAQEYYRQGYKAQNSLNSNHFGQVYFGVANADMYRVILSQEMIRSGKAQTTIDDFFVSPIKYTENAKNMEFLYLADSICTYLSNNIEGITDSEKLIKIVNKANQISNKAQNIIFGYDEIDVAFQNAWELYENGDYFECLKICYDSRLKEGGYSEYYINWFDYIRNLIVQDYDEYNFTRTVNRLHDTLRTNTLDQDRTIYILETLEKMAPKVAEFLDDTESMSIMYTLYDIGVSAYCHIGDSKKAIGYYNKCKKFASRVGVEEYLSTLNKMSETLLDNFEWKKAKQIANDSVKYQEELLKMKNALPVYSVDDNKTSLGLAKAYSQKAQVYAFVRDSRAIEFFKKSMASFNAESADFRITQSYLLHYYLDNGMKEEYMEESRQYFGGEDSLRKQLAFILTESFKETPIINYKYALYVFIRGIYCFRIPDMSDSLKDKLYDIDNILRKAEIASKGKKKASFTKLTGHPSEIIFKYLSMIAIVNGDTEKANEFADRIHTCLGFTGPTIELVKKYGDIELMSLKSNEQVEEMVDKALEYMVNTFESFNNITIPLEFNGRIDMLRQYLSFMYH